MLVVVRTQCPMCRKFADVSVPRAGLTQMRAGAYVQDAFPSLSSSDREKLMTGICDDCFPKEEDE